LRVMEILEEHSTGPARKRLTLAVMNRLIEMRVPDPALRLTLTEMLPEMIEMYVLISKHGSKINAAVEAGCRSCCVLM
jgi:hypothetical protein